jgi:hypothetical protein
MTMQATSRKMKRSFTLTPEAVAFVGETRQKRGAGSDSEALDLLLREAMLDAKRKEIDAAYKAYYDTASDEELAEQREWAELAGPNVFADIDAAESQS